MLPTVAERATANEVAAISMLADVFANAPLMGGHDSALTKLELLIEGDDSEVILEVSCRAYFLLLCQSHD